MLEALSLLCDPCSGHIAPGLIWWMSTLDSWMSLMVMELMPDHGHGSHASGIDVLACVHEEDVLEALGELFEDP